MSSLFGRKERDDDDEQENIPVEIVRRESLPQETVNESLADDLIRRVFMAISDWSAANNLHHLSSEIAFQQAMAILNELNEVRRDQLLRSDRLHPR